MAAHYNEEEHDRKTKSKQVQITKNRKDEHSEDDQQMNQGDDPNVKMNPSLRDSRYSKGDGRWKNKRVPAEPNKVLGIFGFQRHTTDEDVQKLLIEKLLNINGYTFKLINDDILGICKGFCFVEFKCLEDAANAKEILSFESFRGQDLKCDFSYKRRDGKSQMS